MSTTPHPSFNILEPPSFCEYAGGRCDQTFDDSPQIDAVFLYPSDPEIIASTIEEAVQRLRRVAGDKTWETWRNFNVTGQIIFCKICKALRFSKLVVADVTTLNFNLLFEIGYAIGLGKSVLPIRDSNYALDSKKFDELGLLDTLGYLDFQKSSSLADGVLSYEGKLVVAQKPEINMQQPIYVVKSHVENDGQVKLISALKKSGLKFRSFDPEETPRLSLHEAYKQVNSSLGVVVHLLEPRRNGATVHNARCAFVAGMAMAANKRVLELVAKLTFEIPMRDDGTGQHHECFMGGAARLLAHPQLPELVQP